MRKNLRKNRRDRSRGGKKRRVMYKQDFMLRGCPLSALRATLPEGESKVGACCRSACRACLTVTQQGESAGGIKGKTKNTNDKRQSVTKQAKPARMGEQRSGDFLNTDSNGVNRNKC